MEEIQQQGLAKSIGVSNYLPKQLDWILETAKVVPAVNQVEFHPYLQRHELLKYHKEKVMSIECNGDETSTLNWCSTSRASRPSHTGL